MLRDESEVAAVIEMQYEVPAFVIEALRTFENAVAVHALGPEFNVRDSDYEDDNRVLDDARRNLLSVLSCSATWDPSFG